MPIIQKSSFATPFWLKNPHWETILPALTRRPKKLRYSRERITTRDGDFLDLDFVYRKNDHIVILSHGLEGHSDKYYMRGMARIFLHNGWDTLSWNCRSCSGEINLKPRLYHHGATEDLEDVIEHVRTKNYEQIALVGFSLGGSLVIKYLGENDNKVPSAVAGAVAFSTPCQLGSCARELSTPENRFYLTRFLKKLKLKIMRKARQFPDIFTLEGLEKVSSFLEFDTRYTAPLYGFSSADKFYKYASASNYIDGIKTPTLLVNSLNDPMFPDDCYPFRKAESNPYFYFEAPENGGHMGYWWPGKAMAWAELRAYEFISEIS